MTAEYVSIKESVLKALQENLDEIQNRFGIETIGIFGSVARGEDTNDSDVDVLYRFHEGRGDLFEFVGLSEYLENLFNRPVDLVSVDYLDKYIKPYIQQDALLYGAQASIA